MLSVFQTAVDCLLLKDPTKKCQSVFEFQQRLDSEEINLKNKIDVSAINVPGRPELPNLVSPQRVPKRKLATIEGRIALIHAVTHIEFNAINLALDAMLRFQDMPLQYYKDWMQVATEEAQHFTMLRERLQVLGSDYGNYDAHNGLWEMAMKTKENVIARMALVPRVLEARGLDVTPGMIKRLESHGDNETVEILKIIFEQEIGHVAIGSRWFAYACERESVEPEIMFQQLLNEYMSGELRGPFELEARKKAGFSDNELEALQSV